ncbi:hypothetical protein DOTSEDRAFT_135377 [Dothistroma septosporum NZE10]|uniref:BTB domain-containing protein n=1 Tax=Dothistroma septosporum (strain NZE10 / CBS 128990) TaxID=675120 RepID=N1PKJ2_DOTSN|nr:hypothetical protein DOTSEDRAFT_135377 [Dothistroma septosporum NZE10]
MVDQVDVAPNGDLVLIIRDELALRVYSVILELCSPVFKAMLDPHFAEGQIQGASADPKRIALPEDSAEGMRILCLCLHHQTDTLKQLPSHAVIQELAIVADKYGCMNAVCSVLESWLAQIDTLSWKNPGPVLHTICLFDDAERFQTLTEDLNGGVAYSPSERGLRLRTRRCSVSVVIEPR